jgi:hypothetical protein
MKPLLHVLLTLDIFMLGVLLIIIPWLGYWDHNFFLDKYPALVPFLVHPSVRGAVTGLGALDIFLASNMLGGRANSVADRT